MEQQRTSPVRPFLFGLSISAIVFASAIGGALADRLFIIKPLDYILERSQLAQTLNLPTGSTVSQSIIQDESGVVNIAEKSSPSVVTVSIKKQQTIRQLSPFDMFGFGTQIPRGPVQTEQVQQDIGTGFIIDGGAGLIVTNKHVISDADAEYLVVDKDGNEFPVEKFYRDPVNDIGIVQISNRNVQSLPLGDSDQLKVGQSVIAIGTALGEFRHTVTTGVISGLGRGITAGDMFGGDSEELENVIQTDAAINPGNSGGPLLNSAGQVIGVNVAVAGGAENIGFAIPINVIKDSLKNFQETGSFDRPILGVQYQMIPQRTALMNEVPQGAYIIVIIPDSTASTAGLQAEDIITKFDGKDLSDESADLAKLINQKKIGDKVEVEYWRDGEKQTVTVEMKAGS